MCQPDTSRNKDTLCAFPNCTRTVWQDANGVFSSYCGVSHRDAMVDKLDSDQLCQQCQEKPRYLENGHAHPFCGKWCASKSRRGERPSATPSTLSPAPSMCKLRTCNKPAYINEDDVPSEWCSNRHRRDAVRSKQADACLLCGQFPKALVNGKYSEFCSRKCGQDTVDSAPIILEVDPSHVVFQTVLKQFTEKWEHPTPKPRIVRIWKIFGNKVTNDRFTAYKVSVERQRNLPDANTGRRFHGTIRTCSLGDYPTCTEFCRQTNCWHCSIIQSSFEKAQAGSRTNFGRFGKGIYTTRTSSKANDYAFQNAEKSLYKAMLLNEVVLGKEKVLTVGDTTLTQAPYGYDSVRGEPGEDLNYDECIVYKNEAIRPRYLIIYKHE